MNALLDLPLCTPLALVEPALPVMPVRCAEQAIEMALAVSPEVHQAEQTILKAQAAVAAGKLDFVPSIGVVGVYVDQSAATFFQQNIGYVGLAGSFTILDWGKRRNVVRERSNLMSMATIKVQQTLAEVRQKTQKAYRELQENQQALMIAQQLAGLRKEAEKAATTAPAMMTAAKNRALAEVEAVKAELAYRQSYVILMSLIERR